MLTSGFVIKDAKPPSDGSPPGLTKEVTVTFLWAVDMAGWVPGFLLESTLARQAMVRPRLPTPRA